MRRTQIARAAVFGLIAVSCAGVSDPPAESTPSPTAPTTTTSPEITPVDPSTAEVSTTVLATLDEPIATAVAPGGGLWLAERGGRIVEFDPDTGATGETVLDISELTVAGGERGLLSIAADADRLYVSYTDPSGDSRIDAYLFDSDGRPGERQPLLHQTQPFANHNGGAVAIGPDGMLYVGFGDGGSGGDPLGSGQDSFSLLGSVVRIDPRPDGESAYSIPADNPFADGTDGRPEIFLTGVRNPWRFAFDPVTGDLWLADVGQDRFEEVDFLPGAAGWGRGDNLGWNAREGFHEFRGGAPDEFIDPIFEYDHQGDPGGCSVTGGVVYRGEIIPELFGSYVFGDYCTARVWALSSGSGTITFTDLGVDVPGGQLASFGLDPRGEILILSLSGQVSKLGPADN